MSHPIKRLLLFFLFVPGLCIISHSCKEDAGKKVSITPRAIESINEDIQHVAEYARSNNRKLNDSTLLRNGNLIDSTYQAVQFGPLWSRNLIWLPLEDSLYNFIENCKEFGLFPSDYHYPALAFVHRVFLADSVARKNVALWARADVLLTDAFFALVKDLKQGRLQYDSVTLRTDTVLRDTVYQAALQQAIQSGSITGVLQSLEPKYKGYDSLKAYTKNFLAKADFKPFTYLVYPYKDSVAFFKQVETRLKELGEIAPDMVNLDSAALSKAIRKYQKEQSLKVTGRLSDPFVDRLNYTDWEKFKKIAVNLDRYKQLPDTLPKTRVWINLPAYYMDVYNDDTLAFRSKVIVGGPLTRTPLLTSEISNFITLPQWTVPYSIIFKEMLPKIQHNVEFLKKENLMVVDENDSVRDPLTINWAKLNKNHFPYLLKQREGDDNSLGVIKFNFRNKYSVYIHDTNVRWKFNNSFRAISHGCVRVKEWPKLANFLIRNDSVRYRPDSLKAWIVRQEKHVVSGFNKLPLYIRYFTCEGKDGRVKFYDDIYEEDRYLREKYFADKSVQ
jgi:murein L,D-transpeptidase YcbB/YkuD